MKKLLAISMMLFAVRSFSATTALFAPMGPGVIMIEAPIYGPGDQDADQLYDSMNVPVQPSPLGPGKSIVSPGKELNFVCGMRDKTKKLCTITLNTRGPRAGEWIHLDPGAQEMSFTVRKPADIAFFSSKWPLNQGPFRFMSVDRKFSLVAGEEIFEIKYSHRGL